jgi:hypothetical protein
MFTLSCKKLKPQLKNSHLYIVNAFYFYIKNFFEKGFSKCEEEEKRKMEFPVSKNLKSRLMTMNT